MNKSLPQPNLTRSSFAFLMILVVSAVSVIPSTVSSQSYVTITTQATTTGLYTTPVTTQYATSTETSYVYGPKTVTIRGFANGCWYKHVTLNVTQGQQFHIEWTTTTQTPSSLDFYIATPSAAKALWYCDSGPQALYSRSGATGSVDWAAPSAGQFTVILVNNNLNPVPVTWSITTPTIATVTSVSYATETTTNLVTTTTLQIVAASSSFISSWVIGAVGIVVLLIVLVFLISRRRTKIEGKQEQEMTRPTTEPSKVGPDKQFCRECGNELALGSKFCNKCGTKQTE